MAALNSVCLLSIKCRAPKLNPSFKSPSNHISISSNSYSESPVNETKLSISPAKSIATTTLFWTLFGSEFPAMAAKKIAESPEGDIRKLAVLIPIIPAIIWALYNILGPALNQIERMQSEKGNN